MLRRGNPLVALIFVAVSVAVLLITLGEPSWAVSACSPLECGGLQCPSDLRMNPTFEQYRERDYIWQIPENPKGILFLAHGGSKFPNDFFDLGPRCRACYGQPEERVVVLDALGRNYAVIAIKSGGSRWESWPLDSQDHEIVTDLIVEWTRKHGLEKLLLFAWGHSSGGGFASTLPFTLPIRALVVMCMGINENTTEMILPGRYPPTFFVYMNVSKADVGAPIPTREDSLSSLANLQKKGIPAVGRPCSKKRVSPAFLRKRIRCLTGEMATAVHDVLAAEGLLDENDHLTQNPVLGSWWVALRKWNVLPECSGADGASFFLQTDVEEELTVTYGSHSFTSEWNDDVFEWLDSFVPFPADVLTRHSSS